MPSLLIIASNFPPIQSAGVYRTLRLVKYLPEFGWGLDVLTLSSSTLPQNTVTDSALLEQVPDGTNIYRAPARFPIEKFNQITGRSKSSGKAKSNSIKTTSTSTVGLKTKNLSPGLFQKLKDRITLPWMTPDRLVGWVAPAAKLGLSVMKNQSADVIYSSGPPWSNHLVAGRIVAASEIPWVADFRDPWVGNAFRPGRNDDSWAGRKHRQLESSVYENANMVIFNTQRALDDAVSRIGSELGRKSVVIPNGFDPADFAGPRTDQETRGGCTVDADPNAGATPFHMIHTGAFYGKRNIDSLLTAIGELKQEGKLTADDLKLELIGRVRAHEESLVARHSINDIVTLTNPVPHHECLQRLSRADMLLLVQTEAPLCIPGKLYEYIAIGKPVLTLAAEGATADIVASEKLGPCIDPEDRSQLKTGLLDLIQQHRCGEIKSADSASRERYDGSKQMALFNNALCRAMASNAETPLSQGAAKT